MRELIREVIEETDGYNKLTKESGEIPHNWATHVEWKVSTKKQMGEGTVVEHTLTEDGSIEFYTVKFGKKLYENVPSDKLKVTKVKEHSHGPKRKKKKKKWSDWKNYSMKKK